MKYLVGEGGVSRLIWNPNFPYGNKWGWLSSPQNKSWLKGTGTEPSPGTIDINSISWNVLIYTVSFDAHL